MTYWEERQDQLAAQLENDENVLKKKLSKYYESESRKLEKEIAAYYKAFGKDDVIEYRRLLQDLDTVDKRLLMEQMDDFATKYSQYEHLMPVRESIYKLNRLEGLEYSLKLQQLEIGAIEQDTIREHLSKQALLNANAAAEQLGFGKSFYTLNHDSIQNTLNAKWAGGENFSSRIWGNREKLADYLNTEFAAGIARGDSYAKMINNLTQKFTNVSRRDMYRLIYTEGTFIQAEAQMLPFEDDFDQYIFRVADAGACKICKAIADKTFNISERKPGVNYPPMHSYCRCRFTIVIPDDFVDRYVAKHGEEQAQKTAENLGRMKLSIPPEVYKKSRMSEKTRIEIDQAIKKLESEYTIYLDKIEGVHCGKKDAIFMAGGYIEDGVLKHGLILNYDKDYDIVAKKMRLWYDENRFAGRSFEDYIAHEMAHIMPFQNCVTGEEYEKLTKKLRDEFIPGMSYYADMSKDGRESLSEGFVRYRNGEKVPKRMKRLIEEYIEPWKRG